MTIIMGYTVGIVPIVMGDILVTREGAFDSAFNRLAFGRMDDKAPAHVTMLRQKVNIINDNVILAWAGDFFQARAAFRHITETLERRPEAADDIRAVIAAIPEAERDDLSLIGFIRNPASTKFFFEGIKRIDVQALQNAVVAGSGMGYVGQLIGELEYSYRTGRNVDMPDPIKAVLYAMEIAAKAAGMEHASGENLVDCWGGAIEVASFEQERAKKLSDALYLFWDFHTEAGGRLELVPKFVKVEYHNDLLVIFLLTGRGPSRKELTFDVGVWGVPPLLSSYHKGEVVQVPRPTFAHDFLCSQVVLRTGTAVRKVTSHVLMGMADPAVKFIRHGRQTAVQIDAGYEAAIEASARKMLAE